MTRNDAVILIGLAQALLALATVWAMQCVAGDCKPVTVLGRIRLSHRIGFIMVAITLAANGMVTIETSTVPRWVDLATELSLLLVLVISARRHTLGARELRDRQAAPAAP